MSKGLLKDLPKPEDTTKTGWPWTEEMNASKYDSNKKYPKISIVTPSYNQGQFIEETIRTVLLQNYPNLEYIIMDGGSNDNTVEIIKKYEPWIDYWVSEKDKGQSDAINRGLGRTTGEIIGWLNSDDIYYQHTLFEIVSAFQKTNNYHQIIFGNSTYIFEGKMSFLQLKIDVFADHKRFDIDLCDYLVQPSSFWGKSVWNQVGNLSETMHFGFDWDWYIRVNRSGIPFTPVDKRLSCYRIHSTRKTGIGGRKRKLELQKLYDRYHDKEVVAAYEKLNASDNMIFFRKIMKYLRLDGRIFGRIYWYLTMKEIDFEVFENIRRM